MFSTLYIEEAIYDHPLSEKIRQRFQQATIITIERYGEVFNRKAQNFRLQKKQPALILAHKHGNYVLPTPPTYGIGAKHNYYMSHMLNCVYDCRYCFLQGMYHSAHTVLFVNYDDFQQQIANTLATLTESSCFFSGYDCDSLALEPISGYVEHLLPFFARYPQAELELRTKSTQIRLLLKQPALNNVVVAFSLTPTAITNALEHKTPSVERRIDAMQKLAQHGWPIGLRFDPLIYTADYQQQYQQLFTNVFTALPEANIHSVTLGLFRLPAPFFKKIQQLYPDEPLFANTFTERDKLISYPATIEKAMRDFCADELMNYIKPEQLFHC